MNITGFQDTINFFSNSPIALLFYVCFGLSAVGAGFLFSMPMVGNVVATLWLTMMGEQAVAVARKQPSQTDMHLD